MQSSVSRLIIITIVAFTFSSSTNLYAQSFFGSSSGNQQSTTPTSLTPQEYKTKVDALTKEYEKELRQRASERFVKPTPPPGGSNPPNQTYGATGTPGTVSMPGETNAAGGHPSVVSSQPPSTNLPPATPQPQLPPQNQPPPRLKAPTQPQPASGSSTVTSPANQPAYTGFGSGGQGSSGSQSGGQWNVKY